MGARKASEEDKKEAEHLETFANALRSRWAQKGRKVTAPTCLRAPYASSVLAYSKVLLVLTSCTGYWSEAVRVLTCSTELQ